MLLLRFLSLLLNHDTNFLFSLWQTDQPGSINDHQIIFHLLLLLLSFLLLPLESLSLLRLGDRDRRGLQGLFVKLLDILLLDALLSGLLPRGSVTRRPLGPHLHSLTRHDLDRPAKLVSWEPTFPDLQASKLL